jgi:hypothetical protein
MFDLGMGPDEDRHDYGFLTWAYRFLLVFYTRSTGAK